MNKKYVALALVVFFIILALGLYFIGMASIFFSFSKILTIAYGLIFVVSILALAIVIVQRIKEIKKGEEDDISKY